MERIANKTLRIFQSIQNLLEKCLLIFAAYILCRLLVYHLGLLVSPYPLEYREGAMLVTTDLLLRGENPYAFKHMPAAANVYGILYHLLVYPFAKIMGGGFFTHRLVTALCIFGAGFFLFKIMKKEKAPFPFVFSGITIFYASWLFFTTSISRPDGLGGLLFLLSVFIPALDRFSIRSLWISALLAVLAFYTKLYFVLAVFFVGPYLLLFVSKKKAVQYAFLFLLLLLPSVLLMNAILETYFLNTVFSHLFMIVNDVPHLEKQIKVFSHINGGFILTFILYGTASLIYFFSQGGIRLQIHKKTDILSPEKPLFEYRFPYAAFCLIWACIIIYLRMGRHGGNYMVYLYQLITPFLLMYAVLLTAESRKRKGVVSIMISFVFVFAFALTTWRSFNQLPVNERCDTGSWEKIREQIRPYKNILNSQAIAGLLLQEKKPIYDDGHTQYFYDGHYQRRFKFIVDKLMPANEEGRRKWSAYIAGLDSSLENREFDCVILSEPRLISEETLKRNYQRTGTLFADMPHTGQRWPLEVWMPKNKEVR